MTHMRRYGGNKIVILINSLYIQTSREIDRKTDIPMDMPFMFLTCRTLKNTSNSTESVLF